MMRRTGKKDDPSARERILVAAEELFAESGFDATPTSKIAALAKVPKGLVHYYFQKKQDLLEALVARLPDEHIEPDRVVVPGGIPDTGEPVSFDAGPGVVTLFVDGIAWASAPTGETCTPVP